MSDKDFRNQDDFVNEMTRLARKLSNQANTDNTKLEVAFYTQKRDDDGMPDTICSLRYYPPELPNAALMAENDALKAEIAQLKAAGKKNKK